MFSAAVVNEERMCGGLFIEREWKREGEGQVVGR